MISVLTHAAFRFGDAPYCPVVAHNRLTVEAPSVIMCKPAYMQMINGQSGSDKPIRLHDIG